MGVYSVFSELLGEQISPPDTYLAPVGMLLGIIQHEPVHVMLVLVAHIQEFIVVNR